MREFLEPSLIYLAAGFVCVYLGADNNTPSISTANVILANKFEVNLVMGSVW